MPIIDNILIESGTGTKIVADETTAGLAANTATISVDSVAVHTHGIGDIIGLRSELDNKAILQHIHSTSEISDFDAKVSTKIANILQSSGKADLVHTHQASDIVGLHAVAISGNYNSLLNKPVLGSAAMLNIPISGDAGANNLVIGSDSRLTNARTALPHDHDFVIGDGSSSRIMTKTSNMLNFVAGANITLGFDDATKKITISSMGGSSTGQLSTARAIRLTGAVTGSGFFDGSADLNITTSLTGAHTHSITDIAGLQTTIDGKISTSYFSSFGDTLVKVVDQSAGRTLLGLGSIATRADTDFAPISHIGTGGLSHSVATTTNHGFMSVTDKTKLESIAANATANSTDAVLKDRANHTGLQAISTITGLQTAIDSKAEAMHSHSVATTTSPGLLSVTDKAKLDSMAANATANSSDAVLKDRANHTGTQPAASISGLAAIAISGSYSDLTNTPTYGSAATKNVATLGDAQSSQVVLGNDSRLTDSRTPLSHNHNISIGDGSAARISLNTADRLDIVPGANVSVVYDDVLNKITIATTGVIAGSVDTAIKLASARTITLTGGVTGSTTFDGSANVSINAVVADNTHNHLIDNVTGLQAALNTKASVTHTHSTATSSTDGLLSFSDKLKLDGIATNATANSSDTSLKDRANHTGVQAISTITGLQAAIDSKSPLIHSHIIPVATATTDGLFSSTDKAKLDTISSGAGGGGSTISSITGLQAALDSKAGTATVTTTVNGLMLSTDKVKLDGLNSATLLDRANHTGVQAISTVTGLQAAIDSKSPLIHSHIIPVATTTTDGLFSSADKAKLDTISSGAGGGGSTIASITGLQAALDSKAGTATATTTSNGLMLSADKVKLDGLNSATLLDRANHTGVQAISTVTGLQAAIDSKSPLTHIHNLNIGDGSASRITVGLNERLDIAAGSNITIAYDDISNKITINSSATTNSVATADKWTTARTINLSGVVSGSASIDGSANISITTVGTNLSKFYNQIAEPTSVIDGDRWYSVDTGVVLTRIGSVWAEL